MNFLSKLKHDQAKEPTHQNWGILFPLILLIGGGTVADIFRTYAKKNGIAPHPHIGGLYGETNAPGLLPVFA